MMKTKPLLAGLVCVVVSVSAWAECAPIPGTDQIWSNGSLRWVLVGEIHGTNETPAAFGDLVCDALAHGKRVTVALERPSSEQSALDAVITAGDLSSAKDNLLRLPGWNAGAMDGRASEAMLRLLLALREFRVSYPALSLYAFDMPYTGKADGARDEAMGNALLSIEKSRPQDLVIVLTGNAHIFEVAQFGYEPMAAFLPSQKRLSLEVTDEGGEAWTDWNGACGASKNGVPAKGGKRPRGIVLDPTLAPYGKVDGILSLGVRMTASPPAVVAVNSLPACRQKFIAEHPQSQ